jgi:S1-C subfamily serine protease
MNERSDSERRAAPRPPRSAAIVLVAGGVLLGWLLAQILFRPIHAREASPRDVAAAGGLGQHESRTIELFRAAAPSVVSIRARATRREFFSVREVEGAGSGFVWDGEGHVVTNFHVIQGAEQADVVFADGSAWPATLVGYAADRDLAVLHVDAPRDDLAPIRIGSSQGLQVGQDVFAIGNPFGLDQTLTTGIVSALDRAIEAVSGVTIYGVIQTDAAINPGNSGGPLLDSSGRLIGVNTAIQSPSRASAGIGFAVPVDVVNHVVPQLIAYGRVVRPTLGIELVNDQLVRRLGLRGILVGRVVPGSGAEAAGLRGTRETERGSIELGDLIVAIDGKPIGDGSDLLATLADYDVGDEVTVEYMRDDRRSTTRVRLGGPAGS